MNKEECVFNTAYLNGPIYQAVQSGVNNKFDQSFEIVKMSVGPVWYASPQINYLTKKVEL